MTDKTIGELLREKLDATKQIAQNMTRLEEINKERIELQKQFACVLLERLLIVDPDVVVAGGAPRDWDNDRQAKDLDIYIQGKEYESTWSVAHRANRVLSTLGFSVSRQESSDYDYLGQNGIAAVYDLKEVMVPAQLIICSVSQNKVIDMFDCSTSKIWMSPYGYVHKSPEYTVGKKYKTYFLKEETKHEYKERMRNKFPNYKEVIV